MTQSGIEPAIFRPVAQYLDRLCQRVPTSLVLGNVKIAHLSVRAV